jgi:hypothetical protein
MEVIALLMERSFHGTPPQNPKRQRGFFIQILCHLTPFDCILPFAGYPHERAWEIRRSLVYNIHSHTPLLGRVEIFY